MVRFLWDINRNIPDISFGDWTEKPTDFWRGCDNLYMVDTITDTVTVCGESDCMIPCLTVPANGKVVDSHTRRVRVKAELGQLVLIPSTVVEYLEANPDTYVWYNPQMSDGTSLLFTYDSVFMVGRYKETIRGRIVDFGKFYVKSDTRYPFGPKLYFLSSNVVDCIDKANPNSDNMISMAKKYHAENYTYVMSAISAVGVQDSLKRHQHLVGPRRFHEILYDIGFESICSLGKVHSIEDGVVFDVYGHLIPYIGRPYDVDVGDLVCVVIRDNAVVNWAPIRDPVLWEIDGLTNIVPNANVDGKCYSPIPKSSSNQADVTLLEVCNTLLDYSNIDREFKKICEDSLYHGYVYTALKKALTKVPPVIGGSASPLLEFLRIVNKLI